MKSKCRGIQNTSQWGEKKKRKKEVRDLQNFKRMRKNLAGDYLLGKILEK